MICGRIDGFKAVRASGKGRYLSGGVVRVFGKWRQEVGKGGKVLVEKCDGSCVESKLYGDGYLGCGWVVGIDDGLECLSA